MDPLLVRRRTLLRGLGLAPALAALAALPPTGCSGGDGDEAGDYLDAGERRVLEAAAEALVGPGDGLPSVAEARVADFLDRLIPTLPEEVGTKFPWLLFGLEHGTWVFALTPHRFSALPVERRRAYLEGFATSRLAIRRLAYRAIKNLVMLAYFANDATWEAIGYDGPWIPGEGRWLADAPADPPRPLGWKAP